MAGLQRMTIPHSDVDHDTVANRPRTPTTARASAYPCDTCPTTQHNAQCNSSRSIPEEPQHTPTFTTYKYHLGTPAPPYAPKGATGGVTRETATLHSGSETRRTGTDARQRERSAHSAPQFAVGAATKRFGFDEPPLESYISGHGRCPARPSASRRGGDPRRWSGGGQAFAPSGRGERCRRAARGRCSGVR